MSEKMPVIIEKLRGRDNSFVYVGYVNEKPHIGHSVVVNIAKGGPLVTTPIHLLRFLSENEVEFDTRNSTYRLTYLDNKECGEVCLTNIEVELMTVLTKHGITGILNSVEVLNQLLNKVVRSSV